jgi:hypothetical protein
MIGEAAQSLKESRQNWLNPPEWTSLKVLEFPGAANGPWSLYITEVDARGIGIVRYPIVQPREPHSLHS